MSASGSTNYFRKVDGHQRNLLQNLLSIEKASHLGKRLLLPGLLDGMCITWICITLKKVTPDHSKGQYGSSGFLLHQRNFQIFCRTQKKATDDLCIISIDLQISCFLKKSPGYYGPVGWRCMPQCYRRTLDDCSPSKMSLLIPELWTLIKMYF